MKKKFDISAVVLTKNEEKQLGTCLKSLGFAKEIIIIDSGSTDETIKIAKKYAAKIVIKSFTDFSTLRNEGKELAKNNWILYIDADEEVSFDLAREIENIVNSPQNFSAFFIRRRNFYLGKEWPTGDKVERFFCKKNLKSWHGEVHESPLIEGKKGELKGEIIHRTHNDLTEMLKNTLVWSDFEAKARFEINHPKVTWWRIFRMMITSFLEYYVRQRGWRVGTLGLIESIYQAFSSFITYAKLWEMQEK